MASPRRVKPVHPLSGALAADARMSHRDMQILAPKVRVPHRTRPLATNLRPLRKHIGGTSADGTGARMRPLPIKLIDCFDHAVQLGSVHRRPGAWTAATDRSPARAGLHLSRPRCGPTGTTSCPAWTREPTAPDRFDVYQLCTSVPDDINVASYSPPGIADPHVRPGDVEPVDLHRLELRSRSRTGCSSSSR